MLPIKLRAEIATALLALKRHQKKLNRNLPKLNLEKRQRTFAVKYLPREKSKRRKHTNRRRVNLFERVISSSPFILPQTTPRLMVAGRSMGRIEESEPCKTT